MRDASIDSLIKKVISERMRKSSEGCANENTIAAYLEKALSPQEIIAFESHVSECTLCQEVLAAAMKLQGQAIASQATDEQSARNKVLFRFSIPIPVIGGVALAVVLIAVLFRMNYESSKNPVESQTAELHRPAPQSEAAVPNAPIQAPELKKDYLASEEPRVNAEPEKKEKGFASSDSKAEIGIPALDRETAIRGKTAEQKKTAVGESFKSLAESGSVELAQGKPSVAAAQLAEEKASASSGTRAEIGSIPPAAVPAAKNESATPERATVQKMAAAGGSLRSEESVARAQVYATPQDRIQSINGMNMAPVNAMLPKDAISKLGSLDSLDRTQSKKSGDKVFYFYSGYWIDWQCTKHRGDPIAEVASTAPEYEQILQQYPELRDLRQSLIYWNGKIYLLH